MAAGRAVSQSVRRSASDCETASAEDTAFPKEACRAMTVVDAPVQRSRIECALLLRLKLFDELMRGTHGTGPLTQNGHTQRGDISDLLIVACAGAR